MLAAQRNAGTAGLGDGTRPCHPSASTCTFCTNTRPKHTATPRSESELRARVPTSPNASWDKIQRGITYDFSGRSTGRNHRRPQGSPHAIPSPSHHVLYRDTATSVITPGYYESREGREINKIIIVNSAPYCGRLDVKSPQTNTQTSAVTMTRVKQCDESLLVPAPRPSQCAPQYPSCLLSCPRVDRSTSR